MPIIAIPVAAILIGALMCLLIIYGGKAIGNFVASFMPSFHVGPVHINLKGLVESTIDGAVAGVAFLLDAAIAPIHGLLSKWTTAAESEVAHLLSLATNAANSMVFLATVYLPRELGRLRTWTAHRVAHVAADLAAARKALDKAIYDARHLAEAWAAIRIATAVTALDKAVATARTFAAGRVDTAIRDLTHDIDKAAGVAATATAAVAHSLAHDIAAAEHLAATATATVAKSLSNDVASIDIKIAGITATTATAALGLIATDIDQVAAAGYVELTDAVNGAIAVAGTDFPDIVAALKDIPLTQALSVAGLTSLAYAGTEALARYLEDCGMPNCRNLGPLGNFLQDLLGAGTLAALLAMLIEIVKDPEQAAQDCVNDLAGPVSDAASLAKTLLGV